MRKRMMQLGVAALMLVIAGGAAQARTGSGSWDFEGGASAQAQAEHTVVEAVIASMPEGPEGKCDVLSLADLLVPVFPTAVAMVRSELNMPLHAQELECLRQSVLVVLTAEAMKLAGN